jgi:hypothetical protein
MHITLSTWKSLGFKHIELEKWIDTHTIRLNDFERHLRNGHTQTMKHNEPPSKIDKQKKDTMIKPP